MAVLRETGFFSRDEIAINGTKIRPLDITAKLLFPKWKLKEGERDITVMQVIIAGKKEKKKVRYIYDLLDRYDNATHTHSMARTTGYTATTVLRMLARGMFPGKGICPPEYIGKHEECVNFMLEELEKRGINYCQTIEEEN
jgi:saccharopine dehydrogenase-like NADP-dependent oxidoreductase